jgi:three-Cys-motif partner protein
MRKSKPPDLIVAADGLYTPEVGGWAETKHRLLWTYADLFATSMKAKWDARVYIDLFAGAGHARIKDTDRIVLGSPLLALKVSDPFESYVFCDSDERCIHALRQRVDTLGQLDRTRFVSGDVNALTDEILASLPAYNRRYKVLGFCFVDPFALSALQFTTLEKLARRFMDFLVHIPAMDPIRNEVLYTKIDNETVTQFLGTDSWRTAWKSEPHRLTFDLFLARQFEDRMRALGYEYGGIEESVMVRSTEKNLPLYRLGFFSRHERGRAFWREVKKYSTSQLGLL